MKEDQADDQSSKDIGVVNPAFQDVSLEEKVPKMEEAAQTVSSDSEDAMYSVGSTPAGTPVKVPKGQTLSSEECQLLLDMESQNEFLQMKESYEKRIQDLESRESSLKEQVQSLERQLTTSQEDFEKTVTEVKKSLTSKLEVAVKQAESAKKDMESMVIKYAMSEKHVIEAQKIRETSENKVRDVLKDKDSLLGRIKALTNDKTSLTTALDRRITQHSTSLKEIDRLSAELKAKDLVLKQTQQKLQHSENSHDELKEQLLNLNNVMDILKQELENTKLSMANMEDREQQVVKEVSRINKLEQQLKKEVEDFENAKQDVESLKLDYEMRLKQMEECVQEKEVQIREEQKRTEEVMTQMKEIERLKQELHFELDTYKHKDEEMGDLSERLRAKISLNEAEAANLSTENLELKDQLQKLESDKQDLQSKLEELRKETDCLQTTIKQSTEEWESKIKETLAEIKVLKAKVDELENDKRIMSKKHANAMRELTKELQRKKNEVTHLMSNSESSSLPLPSVGVSDRLSATSRTSSSSSLDVLPQTTSNGADSITTDQSEEDGSKKATSNGTSSEESSSKSKYEPEPLSSLPELSRQSLIDRILKLQKMLNKRNEKLDFLEDHNHQLVEELKKKTRLIQYYLLREETGALVTAEMDKNKRDLLKKGTTTMSSLYKNVNDSEMTIELSLEINRKLQAVLEDTILKNITLKLPSDCVFRDTGHHSALLGSHFLDIIVQQISKDILLKSDTKEDTLAPHSVSEMSNHKDLSGKTASQPQREEQSNLSEAALENYEELLRLAERLGDAKKGLDVEQINKMTTTQRFDRLEDSQTFCVVCMTDFNDGDMLRILPVCYHEFHVRCIDEWLKTQKTCPICRWDVTQKEEDDDEYDYWSTST